MYDLSLNIILMNCLKYSPSWGLSVKLCQALRYMNLDDGSTLCYNCTTFLPFSKVNEVNEVNNDNSSSQHPFLETNDQCGQTFHPITSLKNPCPSLRARRFMF